MISGAYLSKMATDDRIRMTGCVSSPRGACLSVAEGCVFAGSRGLRVCRFPRVARLSVAEGCVFAGFRGGHIPSSSASPF
jgi:hypothetical protein